MFCSNCGALGDASDERCRACAAMLSAKCSACGAVVARGARFCPQCGGTLSTPSAPAGGGEAPAPGPRVARATTAFEGERRLVTVLFADLGGSLGAIEGVDVEEAEQLLDAVVNLMIEAVHRFEGTVNQLMGDGIMALFGAPIAHEDHAVRAACAALAMQASLRRLRNETWHARGITPEIRVGLNSGDAIVRSVRNDVSVNYRAIGQTTHIAARMEQLAARGTILITDAVLQLGRGMLRAHPLGPTTIKGLNQAIDTFELTGVVTRTRFQATLARELSPFVGRAEALGTLTRALESTLAGQARSALVIGEPGIGKSRLCFELSRTRAAAPFRMLEASALSYARTSPHALLASLLKTICEVDDDDQPEQIREKLMPAFAGDPEPSMYLAALELLDLPAGDPGRPQLDPVQRLRNIWRMMRQLLSEWCSEVPTILLLEDLHWADTDSLSFIRTLFEEPLSGQLFLLATIRPEGEPRLGRTPGATRLVLHALDSVESASLAQAIVGQDDSVLSVQHELASNCRGNPFFIEESTRAFVGFGVLKGTLGNYVLRRAPDAVSVPAALEALIATRFDQLSPEQLSVLHAASAIGDDSPLDVLRQVLELPGSAFEHCFAELAAADLLYQTGPFRAPLFRFSHALIREVAYRSMLRPSRRALHQRVLDAFEVLYPSRLAEHVERLAEHADRAEQWNKSALYHQRACIRASNRSANRQALAHLESGINAIERLETGGERDALAIDMRLTALAPLLPLGDHERIVVLLREAEVLARRRGDEQRLTKILTQLGTALWATSRYDTALETASHALLLAEKLQDFALTTAARFSVAIIHNARGRFAESLAALEAVLAVLGGDLALRRMRWAGYPSLFVRTFQITNYSLLGRFTDADATFQDALALAQVLNHPYSTTMILEEYAFTQIVRGDFEQGRIWAERAMALCEEGEVLVMHTPIAARLASALVHCGQPERGMSLLEDTLERDTRRYAGHYGVVYLMLALAEARMHTGNHAGALQSAAEAEELTRAAGEHAYHVCALVQLGDVLAQTGLLDRAEEEYGKAIGEAHQLAMAPFEALALQGRAACVMERGVAAQAAADYDAAESLWTALGADARLAQLRLLRARLEAPTASAVRLIGSPESARRTGQA